ncbi:MAG: hypothetical protein U9N42_05635 [Campylobacterota bacterium]|nr:hypothetical protein [Campylobacterota bacterium]
MNIEKISKILAPLLLTTSLSASTLMLNSGWNLVGSNVAYDDISTLIPTANTVWSYKSGKWSAVSPNGIYSEALANLGLNSLKSVESGTGFWVHVSEETSATINGTLPESSNINVDTGWNLVSLRGQYNLKSLKEFNNPDIKTIWKYKDNMWHVYYNALTKPSTLLGNIPPLQSINVNEGFWINSSAALDINISSTAIVDSSYALGVDGYIINAQVNNTYFDENNITKTKRYNTQLNTQNVITGKVIKGSATYQNYDQDLNIDVRYKTLSSMPTTGPNVDGVKVPATYIDVDNSGDYNISVDLPFVGSLNAPVGFINITPITEMIFQQLKANLLSFEKIDIEKIDEVTKKIASALNLTANEIMYTDPLSKPEYAFVNAIIASSLDLNALGKNLMNAPVSTTLDKTFENLVKAEPANGTFTTVKYNIDAGVITSDNIAEFNPDKIRAAGGVPILNEAVQPLAKVTAINIGSKTLSNLLANTGDKWNRTDKINLVLENGEINGTSSVDLVVRVAGPKPSMASDANGSQIALKITDLNVTTVKGGASTIKLDPTKSKVTYEWFNPAGTTAYITASDLDANSTGLNLAQYIDNGIDVKGLMVAVDANASAASAGRIGTGLYTNIESVQAILVDNDSALSLVRIDSTTGAKTSPLWGKTTVAGANNVVAEVGSTLINLTADSRSSVTTTAKNQPPQYSVKNSTISIDANNTIEDQNITLEFTKVDSDIMEVDDTINFIYGSTCDFITKRAYSIENSNNKTEVSTSMTIDTNSEKVYSDTTCTVSYIATDEFGESNTSKLTITLNQ